MVQQRSDFVEIGITNTNVPSIKAGSYYWNWLNASQNQHHIIHLRVQTKKSMTSNEKWNSSLWISRYPNICIWWPKSRLYFACSLDSVCNKLNDCSHVYKQFENFAIFYVFFFCHFLRNPKIEFIVIPIHHKIKFDA